MKKIFLALALIGMLALFTGTTQAAYFSPKNQDATDVTINDPINDDAFISGNTGIVNAPVAGELFIAGSKVVINSQAARSTYAAGRQVSIKEGSGYNAFVAGNDVSLAGTFGHDVYAAGNLVTIEEGTTINGDLRIAGSTIVINGTINGSVYMTGDSLEFKGGVINGDLHYRSNQEAKGLGQVTVNGKVDHKEIQVRDYHFPSVLGFLLKIFSTLILGAFLIFFLPGKLQVAAETVGHEWKKSFMSGLVISLVAPLAIIALFITVIGWKAALVGLMIYAAAMTMAGVTGMAILGRLMLQQAKVPNYNWWSALFLGTVVTAVLAALPGISVLVSILVYFGLTIPVLGSFWINRKGTV